MASQEYPPKSPLFEAVCAVIEKCLLPILTAAAWIATTLTFAAMAGLICLDISRVAQYAIYFWIKVYLVEWLMARAK